MRVDTYKISHVSLIPGLTNKVLYLAFKQFETEGVIRIGFVLINLSNFGLLELYRCLAGRDEFHKIFYLTPYLNDCDHI